jgi:hypothetical protein
MQNGKISKRFAIAILVHIAPMTAAMAQSADAIVQMVRLLKPQDTSCKFNVINFGTIKTVYEQIKERVVVWFYDINGCSGGNTWWSEIAAFQITQAGEARFVLHRMTIPTEFKTFATIKNIHFMEDKPNQNTSTVVFSVIIDALDWGNEDALCCPRDGRQIKLWLQDRKLDGIVIKRWREEEH